jgi:hypothetical protein
MATIRLAWDPLKSTAAVWWNLSGLSSRVRPNSPGSPYAAITLWTHAGRFLARCTMFSASPPRACGCNAPTKLVEQRSFVGPKELRELPVTWFPSREFFGKNCEVSLTVLKL